MRSLSLAGLLLIFCLLPTVGYATLQERVTERIVVIAARAFSVEPAALLALWEQECSRKPVCRTGDHGESYGPFQIKAVRALDHQCSWDWRRGIGNALCAAKIIADEHELTGSLLGAFTRYRCPRCWRRYGNRPTAYAVEVYRRMLQEKIQ